MTPRDLVISLLIPVSSATSRIAACSGDSPSSICPFGSDQSNLSCEASFGSNLPINKPLVPVLSTTKPPALTSSTRLAYFGRTELLFLPLLLLPLRFSGLCFLAGLPEPLFCAPLRMLVKS